jgi:hypothetical protein
MLSLSGYARCIAALSEFVKRDGSMRRHEVEVMRLLREIEARA